MNIFKKKLKGDLEQALEQGLITKEELLRLKLDRATAEMIQYEQKNGGKKRKKRK